MILKKYLFILYFLTITEFVIAQKITLVNVDSIKASRKNSFLVTPLVLYQQETRWAFGLASVYLFRTNKLDTNVRTSTLPVGLLYTLNDQILIGVGANVFFPDEKYILKFENSFSKFSDRFWGIGNQTNRLNEEFYLFSQFFINPQLHRKIYKKFYVGLGWEYQRVYDTRFNQSELGLFVRDQVKGMYDRNEYQISGLGTYYTWDSRNHAYCPTKGSLVQIKLNFYNQITGSNYDFAISEIDFRKFIQTTQTHVLAIQALGYFTFGDVPFRSLAQLGGANMMRGYYTGRFRDKMFVGVQVEYRLPLFWRFGMVGFVGVGQVANHISGLSLSGFKSSIGVGLRFALLPDDKLNFRFDLGIGENFNVQPYASASESF